MYPSENTSLDRKCDIFRLIVVASNHSAQAQGGASFASCLGIDSQHLVCLIDFQLRVHGQAAVASKLQMTLISRISG